MPVSPDICYIEEIRSFENFTLSIITLLEGAVIGDSHVVSTQVHMLQHCHLSTLLIVVNHQIDKKINKYLHDSEVALGFNSFAIFFVIRTEILKSFVM